MSSVQKQEFSRITNFLILRLGDLAVKIGAPVILIHQKVIKNKLESSPLEDKFTFYGEVESVEHEKLPDGRVAVTLILKPNAAQE